MSDLTQRLDDIQARADAATPGPWSTTHGPTEHPRVWGPNDDDAEPIALVLGFLEPDDARATAEFMAHARTDVPALVAALRAVLDVSDDGENVSPVARHLIRTVIATALGVTS